MNASHPWALASGLPSRHVARAARRVASLIEPRGSLRADMRRSYQRHASGGLYPEDDLIRAERMLVDVGFVREDGDRLYRTPELAPLLDTDESQALAELAAIAAATLTIDPADLAECNRDLEALIPDEARRRELLLALGQRFDDTHRRLVGEVGEGLVLAASRQQLQDLGHGRLADQVRHVSLRSDALGYDIVAPRVVGQPRLLEIKSTRATAGLSFFISRNEIAAGGRNPDDWFLVVCRVTEVERREGEILGWCPHATLEPHLPDDRGMGEWQSVEITLDPGLLYAGLPAPS
jgi:hypothetical protein